MFPSLVSNLISLWWENLLLTWILLLTYFMHQNIVWVDKWSVCIWKNKYSTIWGYYLNMRSNWLSCTSLLINLLHFYLHIHIFYIVSDFIFSCCTNYSEGGLKSLSPVRALSTIPSNPFRWFFLWPLGVLSYTYTDQYSIKNLAGGPSPELWNFLLFFPFILLFFKLKYNWFTVIQEYSKVVYAYIFFFFFRYFHYRLLQDIESLYRWSLLFIL